MIFKGISLAQFGTLFASLAGALLLIYILRYRRRGKVISNYLIWKRVVGAKRSIWSEIIAFLLHLLMIALIAFALTDPSPAHTSIQRKYVAVVLDGSISMSASVDEQTRMDMAAEKAWTLVDSLRPVDRAMLVVAGSKVKALTGFTNDFGELKKALEGIRPEGRTPKIIESVEYVKNAFTFLDLGPLDTLHLYVISDRPDDVALEGLEGVDTRKIGVGPALQNTGIIAFDVRKPFNHTGGHELMVRVANYGSSNSVSKMIVYTPGATIGKENLILEPGEERTLHYYMPFGVMGRVTALLSDITYDQGTDGLLTDNAAFAYIRDQKKVRVLLVSNGNMFLKKALSLNPQVSLSQATPGEYGSSKGYGYNAVIFDDFTPPSPPGTNAIYIHPTGSPFKIIKAVEEPEMTGWNDGHPMLRYIKLNDLNIEQANPIVIQKGDTVLAEYEKHAMMLARNVGSKKYVGIGFSLKKTDLPLRIAFPILFHNAIVWFAESDDIEQRTTHQVGRALQFPVKGDPTTVELTNPQGEKSVIYPRSGFITYTPAGPGFYEYFNGEKQKTFAVSLVDKQESDLTAARSDAVAPMSSMAGAPRRDKFWPFIILLVFGLVVMDFWLYNNGKLP